ncbi:MAG: DNA polymerase I [Candidatus Baltobacteraceae bacterium]
MLLDTYGLVYRAFFALPPLTTTRGIPINAAYGFTMMLNKIVGEERPTHVIAAFDKGLPAHRVALYQQYKAQRDQMPDDLRPQFALVRQVLDVNRIPVLEVEGEEADDVIATLARQAEELGEQTVIVTGDTDLLQLVDRNTGILMTRRGITDLGRYDVDAVVARYDGLTPKQLPDYRGLKGDPSDNLPGIPGVGEKTAIKLIKAAGSLDALVANPSLAGTPKLEKLVHEYGAQAQVCRDVSVARANLAVAIDWHAAAYTPPGNDELYRLYSELEFKTLLNKLDVPLEMPLLETQERIKGRYRSYLPATDPPEFAELANELRALEGAERLAFAMRTNEEIGVSAHSGTGLSFTVHALAHEHVREAFAAAFASAQRLAAHDVKQLMHVLHGQGFETRSFADDTMVGAHLLNPSRDFSAIEEAAQEGLALSAGDDVAAHADAVLQLVQAVRPELESRDQLRLYEDVEVPLAGLLAELEWNGVLIDPTQLEGLARGVDADIARLQKEVYDLAGEEFNIGSPQQLGNILFGKLCIPGGKKTKTGYATGVEILAGLAQEYSICARVLEYREVTKLKNTYIDVIPALADKRDGRLRTIFHQTSTATGRLASSNPNLQNIPVRSDLGRKIRKAFVAPPGCVLLAADYSQIELRLMAHLSGDAAMRRAFEDGEDIHDFTARQIFGVPPGERVDGNQRRMAKSVNFGLLYGMSDFGLAQRLEIGRAQAREMTQAYFARFPSVRAYIESVIRQGREDGFVTTLLGRRRYMPALRSSNYMLRSAAEREATNAPLQGSAADIMKLAMVRIARKMQSASARARMLLQIHDELIFEVPQDELRDLVTLVRSEMENVVQLSVPLAVTAKAGANWYDVEETSDD